MSIPARAGDTKRADTVVFVCEHGAVKSLIAAEWFNKLAAEQGLKVRAVSRGMTPDPTVPKGVVTNLAQDGFAVGGFTPSQLAVQDLANAERIVSIGADTTSVTKGVKVSVETWSDVPPASENYAASRDAIRRHINSLLAELKRPTRK